MLYAYRVIDGSGFSQQGELEAASETQALHALFERGYIPLSLRERDSGASSSSIKSQVVRRSDVVAIIRELATLLTSGVGLSEALATLQSSTNHKGINHTLTSLITAVHSGEDFSFSLKQSGLNLPEYVYALTRAGESTGDLGGALSHCAEQLEFEERMKSQTREALIYPTILILTGIGAILFIFSFVVPRFSRILSGRAVDLPLLSEWVLSVGLYVNTNWEALLTTAFMVGVGLVIMLRSPTNRMWVTTFLSRLPILSGWISSAETARWTATLSILVQSRVPILLAIELAAASVRISANSNRLLSVGDDVRLGKRLSSAIEDRRLLDGSALSMLKVGEHSGKLGQMLSHVSNHAAEQHRQMQRRVVALIEPASILIIGLVLAVIMVGIVLAMTSLTDIKL